MGSGPSLILLACCCLFGRWRWSFVVSFWCRICFEWRTRCLFIRVWRPFLGWARLYCSFLDCSLGMLPVHFDFCPHIPLFGRQPDFVPPTFLLHRLHLDSLLACFIHLHAPPSLPLLVLLHNLRGRHQSCDNDHEPSQVNQASSIVNLTHLHVSCMLSHSCFNRYAITPELLDTSSLPRIGGQSYAFYSAAALTRCSASCVADFPLTFLCNWCCSLLGVEYSFFRFLPVIWCLRLDRLINCFVCLLDL